MPIMDRVERGGLKIDPVIDVFVKEELTQDTQLSADEFWDYFASIIEKLSTKNKRVYLKKDQTYKVQLKNGTKIAGEKLLIKSNTKVSCMILAT